MAFKDKSLKAYTGDEPYLFMSYCHRDSDAVEPILRALQTKYHVWYDEGIIPASEWAEVIAGHVKKCGYLLALISKNYLESDNCLDELEFARDLRRRRLLIFLEDIELPDGLAMLHNRRQHIRKSRYNSAEELLGIIARAEGIERCLATNSPNEIIIPEPVKDFKFEASNDGMILTIYKGKGGTVMIPPKSDGKPVTEIGGWAFDDRPSLSSVSIPDSVTSIGNWAFNGCTGLTAVRILGSVISIGDGAFWGCTSLPAFTIPDGVTNIGNCVFFGCTGLTSFIIPDSITSIGDRAFRRCTGLTAVTIPSSVTRIGYRAFDGCEQLKDVYYTGSESQWRAIEIGDDNDPLTTARIHYNTPKPTASP